MTHTGKPQYDCYARARDATCFNCFGALDDFSHTGHAHGHGAVQGWCERCRMYTYFDLEENDPNYNDETWEGDPQ
jgi:hypothetical protein